ncbi:response regulator [Dysgonomonas sp. GY75]|uniref:response regulator n=1 Tax=Dysgonomonas sp. GY75 TaxID=2780419 RepID=UPI001883356E|nr:response regulator [Dysgonomonas sp. GY75]MBF0651517.1 response regulator [Dysgonomonas sp. GY75]
MKEPTLFLINSNEELLCLMGKILSNDYYILAAINGKEGLDIIRNNKIDVVICDEILPDINVLEFCELLKHDEKTKNIYIIVLLFNYNAYERTIYYKSGADSCMPKPFDTSVIRSVINNFAIKNKEL